MQTYFANKLIAIDMAAREQGFNASGYSVSSLLDRFDRSIPSCFFSDEELKLICRNCSSRLQTHYISTAIGVCFCRGVGNTVSHETHISLANKVT